ncbi:unnamed protein product, partial [Porites evermanni]
LLEDVQSIDQGPLSTLREPANKISSHVQGIGQGWRNVLLLLEPNRSIHYSLSKRRMLSNVARREDTRGPTNNSSQLLFDESSASVAASIPQTTDVSDSAISDNNNNFISIAGLSSGPSLSPETVALIGQSTQAAIAAERAKSSSLPTTSISSRAIGVFLLSQHQQRLLLNHL